MTAISGRLCRRPARAPFRQFSVEAFNTGDGVRRLRRSIGLHAVPGVNQCQMESSWNC
jgi:hypothetical protein